MDSIDQSLSQNQWDLGWATSTFPWTFVLWQDYQKDSFHFHFQVYWVTLIHSYRGNDKGQVTQFNYRFFFPLNTYCFWNNTNNPSTSVRPLCWLLTQVPWQQTLSFTQISKFTVYFLVIKEKRKNHGHSKHSIISLPE